MDGTTPPVNPTGPRRPIRGALAPIPSRQGRAKAKRIAIYALDAVLVATLPLLATVIVGIVQVTEPQRVRSGATPSDAGLRYEDVTLATSDGVVLDGWYVPAKTKTDAAVLVLHGYPADKGDVLGRAAFLADTYNLLLLDFRSFGGSGGRFTTMGPLEVRDALAGIDELARRGNARIGVYGFDMGGAVALMALDRTDKVGAVVAESAYGNVGRELQEPYRYLGPLAPVCADVTMLAARVLLGIDLRVVSPDHAAARTRLPVLLIHPTKDAVVPFLHARILQDALKDDPRAEFWFPDGLAHGEPSQEFAARVSDFFSRSLTPSP